MKKKTVVILSSVLLMFVIISIGLGYFAYQKFFTYYGAFEIRWGVNILKPADLKAVFESPPSFNGDGEEYYILEYSKRKVEKIKNQEFWQPINDESIRGLDKVVSGFKNTVAGIEKEKYEKIFESNPTTYDKGDLYYYKKEDDGSYCIVIFNIEKGRMYSMEWIQ